MSEPRLPLLRALLYAAQFAPDPVAFAPDVIDSVVRAGALGATAPEYLEAVRAGLASDLDLARLLPQDHDEATVRAFLREVERLLAGP